MKPTYRRLLAAALLLGAFLTARTAPSPARIDELVELLFQPAEFEEAALAPDGSHLVITREYRDRKVILTFDLATRKMNALRQDANKDVADVRWTGPDSLTFALVRQPQYFDGLYLADQDLKEPRRFQPRSRTEYYYLVQTLPWEGKSMLMGRYDDDFSSPLFKLNLKSMAVNEVEANPGRVIAWHIDPRTGTPRLATAFGIATNPAAPDKPAVITPGRNSEFSMLFRDKPGQPWRAIDMPRRSVPVQFDPAGDRALITYIADSGRRVLQAFDLRQQKLVDQPVSEPLHDIAADALINPRNGVPVGLRYEADKTRFLWLDPEYQRLHTLLQGNFPGETVTLFGVREDGSVLFGTESDVQPGVLYQYSPAEQRIVALITARPAAAGQKWAKMTPVWFAARDGYQVPALLTLPPQRRPGQQVPMVALSHGGPQARDSWGFNPEVQFLAALGYGVLQVNYRGSTGFGEKHELANHLLVHEQSVDDVADGLKWAVDAGFADPRRLAAYGGSYGGYISLELATRYPDLLAATVGFAGVYDWVAERRFDSYEAGDLFKARSDYYIDPKQYPERFARVAPMRHADRIKCPVLLMHGGDDKTVDIAQSKRMADALQAAGKEFEIIKYSQGVHGLPHAAERAVFYRRFAEFLLRHVPTDL